VKQQQAGVSFSPDRQWWPDHIRDVAITHAAIDPAESEEASSTTRGGLDGFITAFGDDQAEALLTDPNRNLTA
jgi:type I restriction enzyme R subunit